MARTALWSKVQKPFANKSDGTYVLSADILNITGMDVMLNKYTF